MADRLATHIWVSAYRARLMQAGIPATILHKGDGTAGAVAIKVAFMDGKASLYTRAYGPDGTLAWQVLAEGAEAEVDTQIRRQRGFDPDLWVVEVEDPRGRHMLDAAGLE